MTPIGDSERTLRRQALSSLGIAVLAVIAAGIWALSPPPVRPVKIPAPPATAPGATAAAAHDAGIWQVSLWRPLSDAPPPPPKATPLTIKVFSILRQADGITAAIDPGAGAPLIYAKVGQQVGEHTVTTIDERGIEVETAGRRQRVELRP
jgi:hypothetical protein